MFRGASQLNLDEKGRISMPARYRDELVASCEGQLVATVSPDFKKCLAIYRFPEWEKIEEKLMSVPNVNGKVIQVQRMLLGNSHEVNMTAQGRILIPPSLREYAELQKQVTLVGVGKKFELWDAERWKQELEGWRQEVAAEGLPTEELASLQL